MKVFVLTDFPSPYQVEFFNEIETQGDCELQVGYLRRRDPNRHWNPAVINHAAVHLNDSSDGMTQAREAVRQAELMVFNYYQHSQAELLIGERAAVGKPWCFWGERPGFRQPAWAGRLVRRWKLAKLHESRAPIWGIGRFAVEEYRKEFGVERTYCNLPYFSDLQRFQTPALDDGRALPRVFLFSGSLIARKGIDLLARAFVRLASEVSKVRLKIAGEGELRETLAQTLRPVHDRVEFTGFRDWDELPALYSSADVLCVPSRYDGWGLVVPEGLAAGLPVIATDRMGAGREFIQTGRNGWLIPAGDEQAILKAMREAASLKKEEVDGLGRQARESVSEHTLQHGATRFVRCAQEVVVNWKV